MSTINLRTRSYLLRIWSEWQDGRWVQRASLSDAHTGERLGFTGLEALCEHLRVMALATWEQEPPPEDSRVGGGEP